MATAKKSSDALVRDIPIEVPIPEPSAATFLDSAGRETSMTYYAPSTLWNTASRYAVTNAPLSTIHLAATPFLKLPLPWKRFSFSPCVLPPCYFTLIFSAGIYPSSHVYVIFWHPPTRRMLPSCQHQSNSFQIFPIPAVTLPYSC
mmetsp:Transcript_24336/g.45021  ORF Transcript_24336/g.45021 Transcript_24336/m.45021 type:complete len:145 (-) Transcript_24336:503-937(-)